MNNFSRLLLLSGLVAMTASADVIGSTVRAVGSAALKTTFSAVASPVPEPAAVLVLGAGLAAAALFRRKPAVR